MRKHSARFGCSVSRASQSRGTFFQTLLALNFRSWSHVFPLSLESSGQERSFRCTGDEEDVRECTHEGVHGTVLLRQVDAIHEVSGVHLDAAFDD